MAPRKRKSAASRDTQGPARANKKQKGPPSEIVGGLKGDYRITGDESASTSAFRTFTIPTGNDDDKVIPCQERQPSKSSSGAPVLIFTHGAGGGLENPATKHFADGYGATASVVCFQGTMNLQSRVRNFAAVVDDARARSPKQGVAVGGRSMGARAAVMVASDRAEIKRLVLVSYPLTGQRGDVRDQILRDLPRDKDVLFLVGGEDGMCGLGELEKVREKMKAGSCVVVVRGADHGMSLKLTGMGLGKAEKERIVEGVRKWTGRVAAEWVEGRTAVKDGEIIDWEELGADDGLEGEEEHVGKKDADLESATVVEKEDNGGSGRAKGRKKK